MVRQEKDFAFSLSPMRETYSQHRHRVTSISDREVEIDSIVRSVLVSVPNTAFRSILWKCSKDIQLK